MKIRIGFRVDAGNIVGAGHLMESLAICKDLRARADIEFSFITVANEYIMQQFAQVGISDIYAIAPGLAAEELAEEDDAAQTIEAFKNKCCQYLLIDLPHRAAKYYEKIFKATGKTCVILDDAQRRDICSSTLVNFSITQDENYYSNLQNSAKYLIGPAYVPLNEVILEYKPIAVNKKIKRIFVNQGGSDPYGTTVKIIRSLERLDGDYEVDVLAGGLLNAQDLRELRETVKHSTRHAYRLFESVGQRIVFEMMSRADIAVTAAGNTLYELAYFGIPSVMIAPREEFLEITQSFEKLTFNVNAGLRQRSDESGLKSRIEDLIADYDLRTKISSASRQMVDGKGTSRICAQVFSDIRQEQCLKIE